MSAFRHIGTQELWRADRRMTARASSPAGAAGCVRAVSLGALEWPMLARIGKYEIEAETGHSAPVRVFRAFDRDIRRTVTLKVLTVVSDRPLTERFRREVASAANLRSESMVGIYELGEHGGQPFTAMQHLGDDDLRRAIKTQRPLTLLQKMLIMWQVAEGARAAHCGGLAYIGIRPSGIALASDGRATIQDFGIVRLTSEEQNEEASYASPEELTADFLPDRLCDIFAFGTVYYELLTGVHPFLSGTSSKPKINLLNREPAPLRELVPVCPEALERLVCRALDKHRALRYQSWDEVQCDAEPILRELKRARAADLLADARRLLGAQEQDEAQGFLRESLELDPGNRKARRLGRVIRDLQHRRMVQSRLEGWSREAGEAAAARHFSRAVDILKLALRLDGVNLVEKNRLEQMCSRMEQSQRSVQLVAEARQLLDQQDLTEAQSKAAEALARDSQSAEASEMLLVIGEAIKSRDRKVRVEQALTQVKSLLLVQSFDTAISILVSLRAEFNSPLIEQWLAHVEAQRAEAERQTRFQVQLSEAQSLLAQQRFAETMDKLEVLGREFPEKGELSDLLVQTRQAKERASAIAQAMAQCDQFRREERFDKALEVVDVALAACPAEPALEAVRHEVEEQWRDFKSAAALRPILDEAEWLVEQDRPDLAVQFLRERAADFSDQPILVSRLTSIEEMLPDWRKQRFVQEALCRAGALEALPQWSVALTVLNEALEACPTSEELLQAAERLRNLLQGQERRKKLGRRLEMIEQKITAEAWSQALSLIETSQKEFPGEPELQDLLEESTSGLRRSQCESITAEVRQCLADDDIEQAEVILRTGLQSLGEEPALYTLRDELEAYRKYRDEWRTAQVFFGRRKFQEAERILVRLADQNRPDVETLLKAVREARAASDEDHFYARGREKALKLIQQQQFQQAADLLCNLLALFPGDPILERDLRSAQGGRDQERPGDTVTESKDIGEPELCEPPAEPMCQASPARLLETESAVAAPARLRSAVITAATLLLLVSASAAVWKLSHNEFPARSRAPVSMVEQIPITRKAQSQRAATETPVASSVFPGMKRPEARAASTAPRTASSLSKLPEPGAARVRGFVILPSPSTVPIVSEPDAAVLPANGLESVNTPDALLSKLQNRGVAVVASPELSRAGNFQQPKFITGPSPAIPPLAAGELGPSEVNLEATVDRRGIVTNVLVLSGHPLLVSAATRAVLKWHFQPATLDGQPFEIKVRIRVKYEANRR